MFTVHRCHVTVVVSDRSHTADQSELSLEYCGVCLVLPRVIRKEVESLSDVWQLG